MRQRRALSHGAGDDADGTEATPVARVISSTPNYPVKLHLVQDGMLECLSSYASPELRWLCYSGCQVEMTTLFAHIELYNNKANLD
jgi:hypothetical protein